MNLILFALTTALELVSALGNRTAPVFSVSQATWESFNRTVGGRLYDGQPMFSPCFTRYNSQSQEPDTRECDLSLRNRNNSTFVSGYFGGYQNINWGACQASGEGCVVRPSSPDLVASVTQECYQGSVPPKYVDARSAEDIQATLEFARTNSLRLVIKNTGHDYIGRSSGPDSLGLWTHNLQPPIELQRNFIPDGCSESAGDTITFGAGQQFAGIYEFAHEHNYRVVGGLSNTVGAAGGWITGGGHSILSNELGLGVDNVQQLKAVLPNGTYITANRCQNQDIFFALRGGGGGTFGVITEMSTLAHPEKPTVTVTATFVNLTSASAFEFISITVANADKWAAEGWGGYIVPGALDVGISLFVMTTSVLDQSNAERSMKPITDFARSLGARATANISITNTYFELLHDLLAIGPLAASVDGSGLAMSSRIIPQENFLGAANQTTLSSLIHDILIATQNDPYILNLAPAMAPMFIAAVAPAVYSQNLAETDQPGGPGASSVTPAWRTGLWHVIYFRAVEDTAISDAATVRDIFQVVHDRMNPLRQSTPNGGAYVNEADAFETDPVDAFWGKENHARLLRIKREVDPMNLLSVHNGVGWDRQDARFRCYPSVDLTA
ncbi:hypothetical protein BJX70DRAFT_405421 [Aspergillus crustosus]